jgi:signal transduction histidine kinase
MSPRGWFRLSLARKLSLLFGTAILLTIGVTLVFPWLHMDALHDETVLLQAKRLACTAEQAVELQGGNWSTAETDLGRRWGGIAADLGLPAQAPHLVGVESIGPHGFRREAADHLARATSQLYYWRSQKDDRVFRLAKAVRADHLDVQPGLLLGLIDVQLPIARDAGFWNTVVTILAGASGAVLALLVFYMVTERQVLRPLLSLHSAAEQVTTGALDARASIASGDEFQKLSEAFNDMVSHLRAAEEEQKRINRSLDIRLGELAETNVALYESNRFKSEFLANVSHELRTPLVSIIGFAELLRDAWKNPDCDRRRLARYSENILTSGRSLLELINDLLDLAKIEAGKMDLHIAEFSLSELCRDLVDFVRPLADQRKQRLTLELPDDPLRSRTDSGKVKQVLYNLLSNALKFTPEEGEISLISARNGDTHVRLVVRDNGPGIAGANHGTIFEKFRQLDSSKTREYQGTGLGLAITRELVHMLGGIIELESELGQGAVFTVVIPMTLQWDASRTTARSA